MYIYIYIPMHLSRSIWVTLHRIPLCTGISGRGLLGKWGPNHAADPIVTQINPATFKLQVCV